MNFGAVDEVDEPMNVHHTWGSTSLIVFIGFPTRTARLRRMGLESAPSEDETRTRTRISQLRQRLLWIPIVLNARSQDDVTFDNEGESFWHGLLHQLFGWHHGPESTPASDQAIQNCVIASAKLDIVSRECGCAICIENFLLGQDTMMLPCMHLYHPTCIIPWLKRQNTCPTCRYELGLDDPMLDAERRGRMASQQLDALEREISMTNEAQVECIPCAGDRHDYTDSSSSSNDGNMEPQLVDDAIGYEREKDSTTLVAAANDYRHWQLHPLDSDRIQSSSTGSNPLMINRVHESTLGGSEEMSGAEALQGSTSLHLMPNPHIHRDGH